MFASVINIFNPIDRFKNITGFVECNENNYFSIIHVAMDALKESLPGFPYSLRDREVVRLFELQQKKMVEAFPGFTHCAELIETNNLNAIGGSICNWRTIWENPTQKYPSGDPLPLVEYGCLQFNKLNATGVKVTDISDCFRNTPSTVFNKAFGYTIRDVFGACVPNSAENGLKAYQISASITRSFKNIFRNSSVLECSEGYGQLSCDTTTIQATSFPITSTHQFSSMNLTLDNSQVIGLTIAGTALVIAGVMLGFGISRCFQKNKDQKTEV